MKKTTVIKRAAALALAVLVTSVSVMSGYTKAHAASGLPIAAGSAWESIVGSAASYAGYNATKKQVSSIADTSSTIVGDFITRVENSVLPDVVTKTGFMDWVKAQWYDSGYYAAYRAWGEGFFDNVKKWYADANDDGVTDEQFVEAAGELSAALADLNTEKPSNNDNKPNPWFDAAKIGGAWAAEVTVKQGFELALSKLVNEIIKKDFNAEYEKAKGKYDWEKLGFSSDYDTLEISKSSTDQFSQYSGTTGGKFSKDNTILKTKIGDFTVLTSVPCGREKMALVTIRNPETGLWKTVFLTEEQLYYFVSSVKSGVYTFSEIDGMITPEYVQTHNGTAVGNDGTIPSFPLSSVDLGANGSASVGDDVFFHQFASGSYLQNPLTVRYSLNSMLTADTKRYVYLQKTNTTVYNIGKTLNVYFWNFADQTRYTGSTTALNGAEEVHPAVKPSIYTNTSDEIDKKGSITINNNYYYDNTDDQMRDTAIDNDLDLTVENIENTTVEINTTLTGIWNTIKLLPRNIYNFFGGVLNKILKEIKKNPSAVFNLFSEPMQKMQDTLDIIARSFPGGITSVTGDDKLENLLDKFDLNLDTITCCIVDIVGNSYSVGLINNLTNLIADIAGGTTLADAALSINTAINSLPFSDVLLALSDLPDNFTFGGIITAINALPLTEILTAINGFSLGDISLALTNIKVDIENGVSLALEETFIPDDDFFSNEFEEMNNKLREKLPYDTYTGFISDLEKIKPTEPENITMKLYGNEYTIVDFSFYNSHKKDIEPYIKGVFFFLLVCFNIRHMYFLIRGSSFINPDGGSVLSEKG